VPRRGVDARIARTEQVDVRLQLVVTRSVASGECADDFAWVPTVEVLGE